MPQLSKEQMKNEINSCNSKIQSVTGRCPKLLRPPYGDYDNALIEVMNELKMYTIQWDVDSRDWKEEYTTDMIVRGVCDNVKSGSIVLFHNAAKNTPEALPIILEKLISEGYNFDLISNMIYKENYTIDHAGMQIKNK